MATRVTGGRAGTMPGPRLAYVALVTTVFGPFCSFNTKTFQNFVSLPWRLGRLGEPRGDSTIESPS